MQPQTQVRERVFGTDGNTEEEVTQEVPEQEQTQEVESTESAEVPEQEQVAAAPAATGKYRIGDKTFATQAEAYAYAENQAAQTSEVDAYRQVLREAISQVPRAQSVTPAPAQEESADELYINPNEYLRKRDERIKAEVLQQVQSVQAQSDADNRVWFDFQARHPDLVDFRSEITALAERIQPEVQAIARSKGPSAAMDYVAIKFKAQAERVAAVLRPKRELRAGGNPPAGGKVETVTPKPKAEKALSFADQIKQIRRRR